MEIPAGEEPLRLFARMLCPGWLTGWSGAGVKPEPWGIVGVGPNRTDGIIKRVAKIGKSPRQILDLLCDQMH